MFSEMLCTVQPSHNVENETPPSFLGGFRSYLLCYRRRPEFRLLSNYPSLYRNLLCGEVRATTGNIHRRQLQLGPLGILSIPDGRVSQGIFLDKIIRAVWCWAWSLFWTQLYQSLLYFNKVCHGVWPLQSKSMRCKEYFQVHGGLTVTMKHRPALCRVLIPGIPLVEGILLQWQEKLADQPLWTTLRCLVICYNSMTLACHTDLALDIFHAEHISYNSGTPWPDPIQSWGFAQLETAKLSANYMLALPGR